MSQIADGEPQHPVSQALKDVSTRFTLPQEQLLEIIDGMEMDLQQTRYLDFKGLQLYCYRVASVVGLLSAEIFGYTDRQTLKYAHDLGIAFQLTNIIRDVGEDAPGAAASTCRSTNSSSSRCRPRTSSKRATAIALSRS